MAQVQQFLGLRSPSSSNGLFMSIIRPTLNPKIYAFRAICNSNSFHKLTLSHSHSYGSSTSLNSPFCYRHQTTSGFRLFCKLTDLGSMSQLELGTQVGKRKSEKRVNAAFWIIILNIAVYVAHHFFLVQDVKNLFLFHHRPAWYQFVTAIFCHANWNHLTCNLFFLYIFGKLVQEEEGSFALWLSYILTGAGANLVSWLLSPRDALSIGASGAVFGLFAISLVKMSMGWRKSIEVFVLGQFAIEKVMETTQALTGLSKGFIGANSLQSVNHIAHISGALVGVVLIWLLSKVPSKQGLPEKPDKSSKQLWL